MTRDDELLDAPLSVLRLSIRALNSLRNNAIHSVRLVSLGFCEIFGLGGKAEGFHFSDVLSFHDEFREDIG